MWGRWRRLGLRGRMVAGVGSAAALSIGALVGALSWGLHSHLHAQTDQVLLDLAQHDAADVLLEREEGVHVHDAPIALPSLSGEVAMKHALVLGEGCEVLAKTRSLALLKEAPAGLCAEIRAMRGGRGALDVEGLGVAPLRVGGVQARGPSGEALTFLVGVEHAELDRSAWELARFGVLGGVAAVLLVTLAVGFAAAQVTRELERLTGACAELAAAEAAGLRQAGWKEQLAEAPGAPFEVATLARTLRRLLGQQQEMLAREERFIAEASHELNTPLAALRGELEVTLRRERTREEYREALQHAYADTQRLIRLAEQLLATSRTRHGDAALRREVVGEVIAERLEALEAQAEAAGVRLVASGAPGCAVWAEREALGRALDNLLQNALLHATAGEVVVSWEPGGEGWVEIVVEDDGVGVPASLASRLFEPFQRASQARGHGLGLAIARGLVRQQGGELAYAPAGRGARWSLRLRGA